MTDLIERLERATAFVGYLGTPEAHKNAIEAIEEAITSLEQAETDRARIAELEAALMIYAEDDNWTLNSNLDPNGGNFCGASFARQALRTDK